MHVFTSVTVNYIPKARVLAKSVKKFHPECKFHLVLSDAVPIWLKLDREPFDSVILIEDLGIPELNSWIFKHSLVEMCTAVKGFAFQYIFDQFQADKVFYFDPDMVVFSRLDSLLEKFENSSVVLTPHLTVPEVSEQGILDNEISCLKHGVYNLGFLAVKSSSAGRKFIDWWSSRLAAFCYDDIGGGLFTDQKWVDLAPCFFTEIHIAVEPIYNVATWNLSSRVAIGTIDDGLLINGESLCFYHFSGFDSGAQQAMLDVYGGKSPALTQLREWYIAACRDEGQEKVGTIPCVYSVFDNGKLIKAKHRYLYRARQDLRQVFPDPFSTQDIDHSYYHWFEANGSDIDSDSHHLETKEGLRIALADSRRELELIKSSRRWRLASALIKLWRPNC